MKKQLSIFILSQLLFAGSGVEAQEAYFIDGYHGGIFGHYPVGQTAFIAQKLHQHPDWNINMEIEPESWDVVQQRDPEGYAAFRRLFSDQSVATGRIEYVNPTYAQSYFFGTSGESNIRQFSYGMEILKRHFPEAVFTTYSAEEPCFTSSLPYILKSFGFSYASTRNPNTMWGGYTSAYGGELVNWVGPDGTKITTVPRYACEDLQPGSTWQSISWYNSKGFIQKCFDAGIQHPVGMCIQDASWSHGWDKGPWLGQDTTAYYTPTSYKTWRNYIQNCSVGAITDDWHFTQEDVLTSLMWGTQVMQKLAQEVRVAENKIIQAEKMATLSRVWQGTEWPSDLLDSGWKKLLLSQHHDCWIVPYNGLHGKGTWAEHVTTWTDVTNRNSETIIHKALQSLQENEGESIVRIYNTLATPRNEIVSVDIPSAGENTSWVAVDIKGKQRPAQIVKENGVTKLLFRAEVPSVGFTSYTLRKAGKQQPANLMACQQPEGTFRLESDLYTLTLNLAKGGIIQSLKAKKLGGKEFVEAKNERSFNELRGYFAEANGFLSSTEQPAKVRILEQGPILVKIAIDGRIGKHPFTQTIRLLQGEARIDMHVQMNWVGNPQIGEPGVDFSAENPRKAFYDDRYKLLAYFPTTISSGQLYKDAPFDVCKSRLENTFFNRWDSIKHNMILHWVDLVGKKNDYGMALFTDHTTSYVQGPDVPLALTLQFSGKGLWGRDYIIDRPTEIQYSLLPHAGGWQQNRIWTKSEQQNEPLLAVWMGDSSEQPSASLMHVEGNAYELVSMVCEGTDLYIRLFNAGSDERPKQISFQADVTDAASVELDKRMTESLPVIKSKGNSSVQLSIPEMGIRTLKLTLNK